MKYLKKILQKNYIYYVLTFVLIILSLFITNVYKYESKYDISNTTFIGKIIEKNIDGNKLKITVKSKEKLIGNYYFKNAEEKNNYSEYLNLGDKVKITGNLVKPKSNTIPNLFNYKKYLYNNKIYWTIEIDNIKIIEQNKNIFYSIKNYIIEKIDKIEKSKNYLKAFILGDTSTFNNDVKNSYQTNGVSHLFAVSGMHISLLTGIIILILKKLKISETNRYIFASIFIILYMFLTGFSASILRAGIFFILLSINKIGKFNIKTLNILLLVLDILLLINPFLLYDIGFQFSYIISLGLIIFQNYISKFKSYFGKLFIVSFISFLLSFPISIYNFFQINLLSIFINLIFVPYVSIFLFPFALITFFLPFLDNILYTFISILENTSLFISNINILNITFSKPNIIFIFLYYILIYICIYNMNNNNYKYFLIFIFMIIIHSNIMFFNNNLYFITIDVGQGDSILIILPHNKGNLLIDTGGKISYEKDEWEVTNKTYSIANDSLIPFFKSLGIKHLDYLILSHGDYDHMGEAINLVENFKVEKVIFNCEKFNELEQNLIKSISKRKISYHSCVKKLKIDRNKLYFLNNGNYDNENDNSSVIYTELNNYKFLFMGDAGVEVEQDLLEKYNLTNIDILKVGHHGSKTSSSKEFIDKITPKYSIISVGKNNRYGHPNNDVLDNLKDGKIYRTDLDGSIMFKIKNNKLEIETCVP